MQPHPIRSRRVWMYCTEGTALPSVSTERPDSCLGRTPEPLSHMRAAKTQAPREGCVSHPRKWQCQSGFLILLLPFCFPQTSFKKFITVMVESPSLQSFSNHWTELTALSCREEDSTAFNRNLQHYFGIPKQIYKAWFIHIMDERNWIMVSKSELFSFVPKVQNMDFFFLWCTAIVIFFSFVYCLFFWVTLQFISQLLFLSHWL